MRLNCFGELFTLFFVLLGKLMTQPSRLFQRLQSSRQLVPWLQHFELEFYRTYGVAFSNTDHRDRVIVIQAPGICPFS